MVAPKPMRQVLRLGLGFLAVWSLLWMSPASRFAVSAQPQQGPPTGSITGSVIDAISKSPLEGAVVYLGIEGQGPVDGIPRVVTDDRGRFVFRRLPPSDRYFVQASRPGYFDGAYGATRPSDLGRTISLAPGDWFSKANVELLPSGSIG